MSIAVFLLLPGISNRWTSFPQPTKQERSNDSLGSRVVGAASSIGTVDSLDLRSGDYFELLVQKTGTDLEVSVLQPGGRPLRTIPCLHNGPGRISELASVLGRYTIQVKTCDLDRVAERAYEVVLLKHRQATAPDRLRVTAERLSAEAHRLVSDYRAESTRTAIQKHLEALSHWKTLRAYSDEIETLNALARLHHNQGDLARAITDARQALALAQSNMIRGGEVNARVSLGRVYLSQGLADQAIQEGMKALSIAQDIHEPELEAEAQYFLGSIYNESRNDYEQAVSSLETARSIWQTAGNRLGQAQVMLVLADIDFSRGRLDAAQERARRALDVFRSLGDKAGEAIALTETGIYEFWIGRKQMALNVFGQASVLVSGSGDLSNEVMVLNATARVYYDLGQTRPALQFNAMALSKNEKLGDRINIAYSLLLLGEGHFAAGNFEESANYFNRARDAFRELPNKRLEGVALGNLGLVYEKRGEIPKALDTLNQSLELIRSETDRRVEASTLSSIGHILGSTEDHRQALEYYDRALELNRMTEDPFAEALTLYRIAQSLLRTGQLSGALSHSRAAIRIIEGRRADVANSSLRTSYFASVRQQYDLYIDVLMRLSSNVEAFEASERSRARTLLDTIAEARLSFTEGVDPTQLQREASLKASIEAKAEQYRQFLSSDVSSKARELSDEIQRLTAEYDELIAQMRLSSPRYAELVRPQPIGLKEVQQEVLDESLLLEYAIGEDNSYLWAVTRDGLSSYPLPKRSEIDAKVRHVRELMTTLSPRPGEKPADRSSRVRREEAQYAQAAAQLSQILLGPIADRLEGQRLVIVAEGILQYLPFGALPSPKSLRNSSPEPLVKDHEIVYLPSASTLAVIRREAPLRARPDRTLAIFADPVFQASDRRVTPKPSAPAIRPRPPASTPRATMAGLGPTVRSDVTLTALPRLPASAQEAKAISLMVPEESRYVALGFDATKAAAASPSLGRYKFVHFATHTVLDEDNPDMSSLVMSLVDKAGNPQNGHLYLRDIYNLRLSAELVVLSACETALGKDVKGEGLMSMVRGFMYSGTPRVLASLWKVDDQATAELMTEFYNELLVNKRTPAAALRQAQITQMQKNPRRSPYYWAGFQLHGEWRP